MRFLESATAVLTQFSTLLSSCGRYPAAPERVSASQSCAGLPLGESSLTPELAQGLIQCLNRDGRIQPWSDLFTSLSHEDFKTVVKFVDEKLVSQPNAREQWIESYRFLEKTHTKNEFFLILQNLLKNPELVLAVKDIMLGLLDSEHVDSDPLIPFLLSEFNSGDLHSILRLFSELMDHPAVTSLLIHSREALPLESVAKWYWAYFFDGTRYGSTEAGRLLLRSLKDGSFFAMIHDALGQEGDVLLDRTQKMATLSQISYQDHARFTANALDLILGLTKNPMSCAKGAFTLNNPVLLSFIELASQEPEGAMKLVRRDFALQCYFLKNICSPDEKTQLKLEELFDYLHQKQFPYFDELILIFKKHGLFQRLADLITNPAVSSQVVPLLGELYDEESFPNWLLLLNLWSPAQEKQVEKFADKLLQSHKEWEGKTAYDLLLSRMEKIPLKSWLRLVNAFHSLNEESAREIGTASHFWQRTSLATEQHPVENFFEQLIQLFYSDVAMRKALVQLLRSSSMDDAARLVSKVASDGTLEQILDFLAAVFQKSSERQKTESLSWASSPLMPASQLRHRYSAENVLAFHPAEVEATQFDYKVCKNISNKQEALACLASPDESSVWVPFWKILLASPLPDAVGKYLSSLSLKPSELNSLWMTWTSYRSDELGDQWLDLVRIGLKNGYFQSLFNGWSSSERSAFVSVLKKSLNEGVCVLPTQELNKLTLPANPFNHDSEFAQLDWATMKDDWKSLCESHSEVRAELIRFLESPLIFEIGDWVSKNPEQASQVFKALENGLSKTERLEVINRLERWLD